MNLNDFTDQNWKILSHKSVVKNRWVSLKEDKCEMPNGNIVNDYYTLEYPSWIHVVAFNEKNELLVIKQYRHGLKRSILEIPCGMVDSEESIEHAAQRELKEETGLTFESIKEVGSFASNPAINTNLVHVFLATGDYTEQPTSFDQTEDIQSMFLSMDKVNEYILSGDFSNVMAIASLHLVLLSRNEKCLL